MIRLVVHLVLLTTWAAAAAAQAQPSAGLPAGRADGLPTARATLASGPITVDGRLDEPAWQHATPVTRFTQVAPLEGQPATEETEVRILYDAAALYVGARMHDGGGVSSRLGRRDMPMDASDWLTILFDSFHDRRTAYALEVNPSGVRRDQTRGLDSEDDSWDPVWHVETSVDDGGWTAEIRIPFSQLRFRAHDGQTWGLQVERRIVRKNEIVVFSFTPADQPGGIPRFGYLVGLDGLRTGSRLEAMPYLLARGAHVNAGGNPLRTDREYAPSVGVDLKYRVSSAFTLDVTANPDFGQVEADPAEVNLSALETLLRERRPFFVEGREIFDFGNPAGNRIFYSRRIGRAPQDDLSSESFAAVPSAARILGAAKLTGRTRDGWSVGVLGAATRREQGQFLAAGEAEGGAVRTATVEPLTGFVAGRFRKSSGEGRTVVGGMATALARDLDDAPTLRPRLHAAAFTGGIDFQHHWAERTWALTGFVSSSHVQGSSEALLHTQRAPWRYYQRPDARGQRLDTTRTALTGAAAEVEVSRRVGRHWQMSTRLGTVTPGYEVNDLGYQTRANRIDAAAGVGYNETRPGRVFRSWRVRADVNGEWDYDGEHLYNRFHVGSRWQFLNYWTATLNTGATLPTMDDQLTRGGPLTRRPANGRVYVGLESDFRKPVAAEAGAYYQQDRAGGSRSESWIYIEFKPTPRVSASFLPVLNREHAAAHYVTTVADPLATHTFGRRYVVAELDRTTLLFEGRLNVTFTRALSLQAFGVPYVAVGHFGTPSELAAPGSFGFRRYGRDVGSVAAVNGAYEVDPGGGAATFRVPNLDHNYRNLRGSAVLRWEWRPGSTAYVAWQQDRTDAALLRRGVDVFDDFARLGSAPAENFFMLKVSYWFNP